MWTATRESNRARAALLAALLTAGACAHQGPDVPAAHRLERDLKEQAVAAAARGSHGEAAALFEEALRVARSIEDTGAAGAALVNLASLYRVLGEREKAREAVGEVLGEEHPPYPAALQADGAFVGAMLELDEGRLDGAAALSSDALELCRQSACGKEGKMLNLQGRVASLRGDRSAAAAAASSALAVNRAGGERREEANSLRILADLRIDEGRPVEARDLYSEALAVDKELGLSGKIAADILGIAVSFEKEGRREEAWSWYTRALRVSLSSGDSAAASSAAEGAGRTGPPGTH